MNLSLSFREQLVGRLAVVGEELDQLVAQLNQRLKFGLNGSLIVGDGGIDGVTSQLQAVQVLSATSLVGSIKLDGRTEFLSGPWVFDPPGPRRAVLKPAQISGATNNFAPLGIENAIGLMVEPSGSGVSLTGLQDLVRRQRLLFVRNRDSTNVVTLKHADAGSTAEHRFDLPFGVDLTLGPGQGTWLFYDNDRGRWTSISDATGGQIPFPATQNASSNANTLDDYEEGTWTPTYTGYTGAVTTNLAKYTKIGNVVYCWLDFTGTSNTNALTFTLPFTSISALSTIVGAAVDNGAAQTGPPRLDFVAASATVTAYRLFDGTAWTNAGAKAMRIMFHFYDA